MGEKERVGERGRENMRAREGGGITKSAIA